MTVGIFPTWLHWLSLLSLLVAGLCAIGIVVDETRTRQKMRIMYAVWPLTALFGGPLWLWLYWRHGRNAAHQGHEQASMPVAVAKGASHCGAGCTLGDIIAEWLAFAVPGVAVLFGWHSLFAEKTFAVWVLDYVLAFLLGIAFQYLTIKPMHDVSVGQGLLQAIKADFLSISAWQIGMYSLMAIIQFALLKPRFATIAPVDSVEFWFAMQCAMLAGFATSSPVNWWLIARGIKEKM
jgi:branched-subunit amino acid transport protein